MLELELIIPLIKPVYYSLFPHQVSAIFRHNSIGRYKINYVVSRIVLITNAQVSVNIVSKRLVDISSNCLVAITHN